MIDWIVGLIERACKKEVHIFSLDFSSALLANILHATNTHDYFIKNPKVTKGLMVKLLKTLKE